MNIKRHDDAATQVGEELPQHIAVRLAAAQVHQPLFTAAHDPVLFIEDPDGRVVQHVEHFVAVRHAGCSHLCPQFVPRYPGGLPVDQGGGNGAVADYP